jgi:hypothetical protein
VNAAIKASGPAQGTPRARSGPPGRRVWPDSAFSGSVVREDIQRSTLGSCPGYPSAGGRGAVGDYLADDAFQGVFGAYPAALDLGVGFGDGLEGLGHAVWVPAS